MLASVVEANELFRVISLLGAMHEQQRRLESRIEGWIEQDNVMR